MHSDASIDLAAELKAALDWWREAGVDCLFEETPRQWLATLDVAQPDVGPANATGFPTVKPAQPSPPPPPRAAISGDRASWPQELGAFAAWWLTEPSLDPGQLRGRVPPRGPGDAALMVLVAHPEADDGEMLLAGAQGKLLGAVLAAMGIPAEDVYIASALPRHTPMADWTDLATQGLGDVLRHHVTLVRPQRAIAFGRHVSTLLGDAGLALARQPTVSTQTIPDSAIIRHEARNVPLLVVHDLGSLLERPSAKGAFWQHWLEWSAGE